MGSKSMGIYVHIPFCVSKCSYCAFVSRYACESEISTYIKALKRQIVLESPFFKDRQISSIYFGGGTPSFIKAGHITSVLKLIKKHYNVSQSAEITIECNPCSAELKKLRAYKSAGVNRISFGVQSLNNNLLKIINRRHTAKEALKAIKRAYRAGINNISCDLLIGIPNQTKNEVITSIKQLSTLNVKHISAYMLMLEEGTPLYNDAKEGKVQVLSDDMAADIYDAAHKELKLLGYKRYEVSNFARKGYESQHNINYWETGEYLGFGMAAHSHILNYRIEGIEEFDKYYNFIKVLENNIKSSKKSKNLIQNEKFFCDFMSSGKLSCFPNVEILTKKQEVEEYVMLALRQAKGVNLKKLLSMGYDILNEKKDEIQEFLKQKVIKISRGQLKICDSMFSASNYIIVRLI